MGGCPTGTAPGSFPRGGRKRGLQTDLQNEIVQEIEDLLARQSIADLDLEALEMAARCQALRLAARAREQRLNTDTSDYVGPALPCPWRCGPLSRPSREDLRKRVGTSAFEAGLLRLWPMPPGILPAGPSAETGIVFPDARSSAHDY